MDIGITTIPVAGRRSVARADELNLTQREDDSKTRCQANLAAGF